MKRILFAALTLMVLAAATPARAEMPTALDHQPQGLVQNVTFAQIAEAHQLVQAAPAPAVVAPWLLRNTKPYRVAYLNTAGFACHRNIFANASPGKPAFAPGDPNYPLWKENEIQAQACNDAAGSGGARTGNFGGPAGPNGGTAH